MGGGSAHLTIMHRPVQCSFFAVWSSEKSGKCKTGNFGIGSFGKELLDLFERCHTPRSAMGIRAKGTYVATPIRPAVRPIPIRLVMPTLGYGRS